MSKVDLNEEEFETIRRFELQKIHSRVQSHDENAEKVRLQKRYGNEDVFSTDDIRTKFEVIQFLAPFIIVKEKSTGKMGSMKFQHEPRWYFDFRYSDNTKPNRTLPEHSMAKMLGIWNEDDQEAFIETMFLSKMEKKEK